MTGVELIAKERQEQIEKHGRTVEYDVFINKSMQLSEAAASLIHPDISTPRKRFSVMPTNWDDGLSLRMCKKQYLERLVISGALIAAEIDRVLYLSEKQ
jgi:hypothetical protein